MIESMRHLLLGFVITCTLSQSAQATIVESLDLREMVSRSERIVRGRVAAQKAYWADGRIWTDVTIRVDATFKGAPAQTLPASQTLIVRHLGGTVNGIGSRTIGEVQFAPNEEVFLFLRHAADAYQTVGLSQGKLRIVRDASGARAVGNLQGAKLLGPDQPLMHDLGELERSVKSLAGARR
jgi:hypothetical protein